MQFPLCHTHSLSICIKLKESEDLFIWEGLKNVFIPVAIVMNRDNDDCTITAITHLKRVVLSNSNNTTAMQESAVIKERWEHRSIACL